MAGFSRFTPLVRSLPASVPFVGPETLERRRGASFSARLGANESGFGPSPAVVEAMRAAAPESWKYADPEHYGLKPALARHLGVGEANLVIDGGIDTILGVVARLTVAAGTVVVTSLGAYPTFNFHVAANGGRLVTVPYREDREDLEGLLDAVRREAAALVYLSNPDNPMGSVHAADDVLAFAEALPETTLLMLDEAYCETAPAGTVPPVAALIDRPNVVRARTFSKAYGLAGARIGYAFGHPGTIGAFDKVRNHFGVNRPGLLAAEAALGDGAHLRWVVEEVARARTRIAAIARDNGLAPLASATNFIAVDCGRDGAHARAVLDGLAERGVFVRMPGVAPLDRCIRVSAAPQDELAVFAEALPAVLTDLG